MKQTKLQTSIEVLTDALQNDEQLYESYKANIAMAFVDRFAQHKRENKTKLSNKDIHTIANEAADNFLKLLCK